MKHLIALCLFTLVITPTAGCGTNLKTNVSPVADIANAGGKIEESGQAIFKATIASTAPQNVKNDVALAVNKLGHAGLTLNAALTDYNAAKAAGTDLTKQRAAIQAGLAVVQQFLTDINKALPPGTLQAVDALVNVVLQAYTQIKVGVGL